MSSRPESVAGDDDIHQLQTNLDDQPLQRGRVGRQLSKKAADSAYKIVK